MDTVTIIGFLASFLCSITFLPQAIKTLKTKHTKDLSLQMLLFSFTGNLCWLIHAISLDIIPLAVSASMILLFNTPILLLKLNEMLFKNINNKSEGIYTKEAP